MWASAAVLMAERCDLWQVASLTSSLAVSGNVYTVGLSERSNAALPQSLDRGLTLTGPHGASEEPSQPRTPWLSPLLSVSKEATPWARRRHYPQRASRWVPFSSLNQLPG